MHVPSDSYRDYAHTFLSSFLMAWILLSSSLFFGITLRKDGHLAADDCIVPITLLRRRTADQRGEWEGPRRLSEAGRWKR